MRLMFKNKHYNTGGKKGFVTIATGKEQYYRLARNLFLSYKYFTKEPLPFALLCDRENEYSEEFDQVVLIEKLIVPIWIN